MTIIDLTPEEFRCAATMSCPRVLARAACDLGASCPAVLEGKPDTLIIIGKVVLNNPEIDDMVGCGEDAVEIDRALVAQAIEPALLARIAELEAALKAIADINYPVPPADDYAQPERFFNFVACAKNIAQNALQSVTLPETPRED